MAAADTETRAEAGTLEARVVGPTGSRRRPRRERGAADEAGVALSGSPRDRAATRGRGPRSPGKARPEVTRRPGGRMTRWGAACRGLAGVGGSGRAQHEACVWQTKDGRC